VQENRIVMRLKDNRSLFIIGVHIGLYAANIRKI